MRIAQIAPPWLTVPPARYGGTERVVSLLADGLAARGHDVTHRTDVRRHDGESRETRLNETEGRALVVAREDERVADPQVPAPDVHAGRVVKGIKFLELRDAGDPVESAKA